MRSTAEVYVYVRTGESVNIRMYGSKMSINFLLAEEEHKDMRLPPRYVVCTAEYEQKKTFPLVKQTVGMS